MKIRVSIREAPLEENGYGFLHTTHREKRIRKFCSWDEAKLVAEALGVPLHEISMVLVLKPTPLIEEMVEITYS